MTWSKVFINAMIGWVPDLLIAWGYSKFVDGGWPEFWTAIIALQALYLALWLKKAVWGWLVWSVYGRYSMARTFEKYFRDNNFPRPEMWVGTLSDFLEQILADEYADQKLKTLAAFEQGTLNGYKVAQANSLFFMMDLASKRAITRYARYAPERREPTLQEQGFG
jgi:hypothetical protein